MIKPLKKMGNLTYILLSERGESGKDTYHKILPIFYSGKSKNIETVKRLMIVRDLGKGRINRWSTEDIQEVKILC